MTNVRNDWQETTLGKIADFRNGVNYTKENFGRGVKVINVKDFQDYATPKYDTLDEINPDGAVRAAHLLQENDVIFVRSNGNRELIGRSLALLAVPPEPITHSAFTIRVRLHRRPELNPRFYAYVFRSGVIRQILSAQGNGANISNLNQDILERLVVPLPPRGQQDRIAAILSAYDELIENNTRRIAILEEIARRLYEEWFAEERMSHQTDADVAPSVARLGQLVKFDKGLSYKGEFLREDGSAMVNLKNFDRSGGFRRDGLKFYAGDFKERHTVHPGDIVVANTDLTQAGDIVGSPAIVPRKLPTERAVISHHLFAVRLKEELQEEKFFFFHLLASPAFKSFARGHAVGTTVLGLHRDSIESFQTTLTSSQLRRDFSRIVSPLHELVEVLAEKNANLRAQRDMLLPKLISGEIDVSGSEGLLEAAE